MFNDKSNEKISTIGDSKMILSEIKKASRCENGICDDGIWGNPNWKDFDVNDRSHWAYVGLSDEEFEGKRSLMELSKQIRGEMDDHDNRSGHDHELEGYFRRTWDFGIRGNGYVKFFKVFEYEEDGEYFNPIGYLAIHYPYNERDYLPLYDRAMVLMKDVDGWDMGKIQALLMNKMLGHTYVNFDAMPLSQERVVVPFKVNGLESITASAEKDGFLICSSEINTRNLSAVERNAICE